jgi:hypothetical protein
MKTPLILGVYGTFLGEHVYLVRRQYDTWLAIIHSHFNNHILLWGTNMNSIHKVKKSCSHHIWKTLFKAKIYLSLCRNLNFSKQTLP